MYLNKLIPISYIGTNKTSLVSLVQSVKLSIISWIKNLTIFILENSFQGGAFTWASCLSGAKKMFIQFFLSYDVNNMFKHFF